MRESRFIPLLPLLLTSLAAACPAPGAADGGAGADDDGGPNKATVEGVSLLSELAGLWSGPATQTLLGDFPRMNIDLRPVDERTLFGRVDLDAENSLRFLFTVEEQGGEPVLVYRNGGLFQGFERDSRTTLQAGPLDDGAWRFCSLDGGCDYIDAIFELDGDDLLLDATVNGDSHVIWTASRLESREVPAPFPSDDVVGAPDQGFPEMPRADATATWTGAAEAGARVLLSLSVTECPLSPTAECAPSRWFVAPLSGGETSTTVALEQLHGGPYYLNAVLDRDGDGVPSSGDAVTLPNRMFEVAAEGTSTVSVAISIGL